MISTNEITESELTQLINRLNLDELNHEFPIEDTDANEGSSNLDGWVQVKGQAIIIHDPKVGGKSPVIRPMAPVKLIVNGKVVESECTVTSNDHVQSEIVDQDLFKITVSEDKLCAYFQLISKERYAWQLADTEPTPDCTIAAVENKDAVIATLHLSDVLAGIERMTIASNLNIGVIQSEFESPTHRPVLIAQGKKAIPGMDAQLEVYFSDQLESQFFEVSGQIDFRNHLQIPSVSSGDLIARKIPLVEGVPGYDVHGNVIVPEPPKDIIVVTMPSVELTKDGDIIALKSGRPRITGKKVKTLDITTSYIVPGNVDIETGNIVFSGDVIVYGNVTDNMIIESLGNVYVYGSVFNATITATGSVYIRGNVLGSKLYCGYFGVIFNRLYHALKILGDSLDKLQAASKLLADLLESRKQKVRYGQIVMLLIENKFHEIPHVIRELLGVIANIQHIKKDEYQKLKGLSSFFLQPRKVLEMSSSTLIQSFLSMVKEARHEVARMQEVSTEIKLNQCHNSEVKSNGDVFIENDGVILSDVYAARNIVFRRDSAVCRGSRLEASGSIAAKLIGGQTGAKTLLRANRFIKVERMYSGRVCIGKQCVDIDHVVESKTFSMEDLKQLIVSEGR